MLQAQRKGGRQWCEESRQVRGSSCQSNDMDVDMDENEEELSFIPSAVSTSAYWYEGHCHV